MTSPFYSRTLLFTLPLSPPPLPSLPPFTGSQCAQYFGNDKVYLQSKGQMLTANWPVSAILIL